MSLESDVDLHPAPLLFRRVTLESYLCSLAGFSSTQQPCLTDLTVSPLYRGGCLTVPERAVLL